MEEAQRPVGPEVSAPRSLSRAARSPEDCADSALSTLEPLLGAGRGVGRQRGGGSSTLSFGNLGRSEYVGCGLFGDRS